MRNESLENPRKHTREHHVDLMRVVQTYLVPGRSLAWIIILLFQDWSDVKNVITRFAWGKFEASQRSET